MADRYTLELQALAASLTDPAGDDGPAVLTLDQEAASCCSASSATWSRGWPPAAATWPTGRLGGQARRRHLPPRRPPAPGRPPARRLGPADRADTFAGAVRLADYLVEHARAVFDLMGADPRVDDARWLLDWISRTNRTQFSRRDAHQAAPRPLPKATDLEPALALLEEHGWLRRVDPDPSRAQGGGRPASPRFLVNPCTAPQKPHNPQNLVADRFCGF